MKQQFLKFFSQEDWDANQAMQARMGRAWGARAMHYVGMRAVHAGHAGAHGVRMPCTMRAHARCKWAMHARMGRASHAGARGGHARAGSACHRAKRRMRRENCAGLRAAEGPQRWSPLALLSPDLPPRAAAPPAGAAPSRARPRTLSATRGGVSAASLIVVSNSPQPVPTANYRQTISTTAG
jgi:hypothetical protein